MAAKAATASLLLETSSSQSLRLWHLRRASVRSNGALRRQDNATQIQAAWTECYAMGCLPPMGRPHLSPMCGRSRAPVAVKSLTAAEKGACLFSKHPQKSTSCQLHLHPCHWLPTSRTRDVRA